MEPDAPEKRFDERDVIFARARLEPGMPEYDTYYQMRPENKAVDDRARKKPGLLSPDSQLANMFHYAAADASFFLTEAVRDAVDGTVADTRYALPPAEMTAYLKGLTKYYGALDVGITKLEPYHIYSHIGRGTGTWGAEVELPHQYAIAFTVEMDYDMMGTSPNPPVTMESAKEYVEAARIAVQLAAALRNLGYKARAHIDGNYRVIAPLVARDAGLGEVGRLSLLITKAQGPRVRIGVVTTDAVLIPDGRKPEPAVIDFCNVCKKCANSCPSHSISFDERKIHNGALRWKIQPETCYAYWCVIGTDCGKCVAVCPFSHPDTFAHRLVRWGIYRSGFFRRFANWMDDVMYGKVPAARQEPDWTQVPAE
jgi:ferredoxin